MPWCSTCSIVRCPPAKIGNGHDGLTRRPLSVERDASLERNTRDPKTDIFGEGRPQAMSSCSTEASAPTSTPSSPERAFSLATTCSSSARIGSQCSPPAPNSCHGGQFGESDQESENIPTNLLTRPPPFAGRNPSPTRAWHEHRPQLSAMDDTPPPVPTATKSLFGVAGERTGCVSEFCRRRSSVKRAPCKSAVHGHSQMSQASDVEPGPASILLRPRSASRASSPRCSPQASPRGRATSPCPSLCGRDCCDHGGACFRASCARRRPNESPRRSQLATV